MVSYLVDQQFMGPILQCGAIIVHKSRVRERKALLSSVSFCRRR